MTGDNYTSIKLTLGGSGGTLNGVAARTVSGGYAQFTNLSISTAVSGSYSFSATDLNSSPSLTPATSTTFTINP